MSAWLVDSQEDLGSRIAEARISKGLTQSQLAAEVGFERTVLSKIENGRRNIEAVELARLADALDRSVDWFLRESPASVVSRREGRLEQARFPAEDELLERLCRDVELLIELDSLPTAWDVPRLEMPESPPEAEDAAQEVRGLVGEVHGPLTNLQGTCEQIGLLAFGLTVGSDDFDGAYAALESGGLCLVAADSDAGRKRFTLAHELGHHVFADEYATDIAITESSDRRERLLNSFAVHLLMPRDSFESDWHDLDGDEAPWRALLHLGVDYRVSWTAVCAHAQNLDLIDRSEVVRLQARTPTRANYLEEGLHIVEELIPPALPTAYVRGVLTAYRRQRISKARALEMLHGAVDADDLPSVSTVPIDALRPELDPL